MQDMQAERVFQVSRSKTFLVAVFTLGSAHCSCLLVSLLTHFAQIKIYHRTIREISQFVLRSNATTKVFERGYSGLRSGLSADSVT